MTTHDLSRQMQMDHSSPVAYQGASAVGATAAKLTAWAGWSMIGIAGLHVVFWSVVTWADWGAWFSGDLWGAEPSTALEYRLHHGYWALVGSFAVPFGLLGVVTIHLTRLRLALPRHVGWVVLAWVLLASALMEPNGFPLGFIPAALLLTAQHVRRGTMLPTTRLSTPDQLPEVLVTDSAHPTTAHPPGVLPPGQRRIDFFPRIGRRTDQPTPTVGDDPTVVFGGAVTAPIEMTVEALVDGDRRHVHADFHCVAGWSVTGLHWEGVAFADVYQRLIAPAVVPGTTVTHVMVRGLDGERFVAELGDLLAEDVLLADRLDGQPLDGNHGAPLRLVSPAQYGYANIKHVCCIDVLAGPPPAGSPALLDRVLQSHPRARVWEEERHGSLPSWLIRPIYRVVKTFMLAAARRGRA